MISTYMEPTMRPMVYDAAEVPDTIKAKPRKTTFSWGPLYLQNRDFKLQTLTLTLTLTINVKANFLHFLIKCLSLKTATLQNKFSPVLQYDAFTLICRFKKYFEDNRDVSKIVIKYI